MLKTNHFLVKVDFIWMGLLDSFDTCTCHKRQSFTLHFFYSQRFRLTTLIRNNRVKLSSSMRYGRKRVSSLLFDPYSQWLYTSIFLSLSMVTSTCLYFEVDNKLSRKSKSRLSTKAPKILLMIFLLIFGLSLHLLGLLSYIKLWESYLVEIILKVFKQTIW